MTQTIAKKEMIELLLLWDRLGDVPTVFDMEDGVETNSLEEAFLHFPAGTHREEVWHWFEAQNPDFVVGEVMSRKYQVIYSRSEGGFWSNNDGWGDLDGATVFHEGQINNLRLPMAANNDAEWLYSHFFNKTVGGNMQDFRTHNATDAIQCLVEDFDSYIDGSVEPDMESHECSRENAVLVQEALQIVRDLGAAIEKGDPQEIANIWLALKPQVALCESAPAPAM